MNIKELASKYELTENDFWELRKNSNKWIITHDACEKIAHIENVELVNIQVLNSEVDLVRFLITMKLGEKEIKTISSEEAHELVNRKQCNLIDIRDIRDDLQRIKQVIKIPEEE